jgi:23S rRNA (uridine2552-2'-O)-methyltransferase
MKRSKTSRQWMQEHVSDPYVKQARKLGYRSRAAFKLIEIDGRDKLLKRGMRVVDLGAAPGGWCQVLSEKLGDSADIVGIDLLSVKPVPGVILIQGDFTGPGALAELDAQIGNAGLDLVLSDMAPNMSGVAQSDQARHYWLCSLALEFARERLKPDGAFLVKVFQGAGFEEFLMAMRAVFRQVLVRKPDASRDRSAELFLLGRGLRPIDGAGDSLRAGQADEVDLE